MKKLRLLGAVCLTVIAVNISLPVESSVLHEQLWNGNAGSYTSIDGPNLGVGCYPCEQDVADDFTPSNDWNITSVGWTGLYEQSFAVGMLRNVAIEFYHDINGLPDSVPFYRAIVESQLTFVETINPTTRALDVYNFTAELSTELLTPSGATYYFSVADAEPDAYFPAGMFWNRSDYNPGAYIRNIVGGLDWTAVAPEMAYTLYGQSSVVPIPPAVYLFGSGLLGLVGIARKKTINS